MNKKVIIAITSVMLLGCMSIPVFAGRVVYPNATHNFKSHQETLKIVNKSDSHTIEVTAYVCGKSSNGTIYGANCLNHVKIKMKDLFTYSKTLKSTKNDSDTSGIYKYIIDSNYGDSGTN